jgi:hypothetical protein
MLAAAVAVYQISCRFVEIFTKNVTAERAQNRGVPLSNRPLSLRGFLPNSSWGEGPFLAEIYFRFMY